LVGFFCDLSNFWEFSAFLLGVKFVLVDFSSRTVRREGGGEEEGEEWKNCGEVLE
jgi:hypothetical protein